MLPILSVCLVIGLLSSSATKADDDQSGLSPGANVSSLSLNQSGRRGPQSQSVTSAVNNPLTTPSAQLGNSFSQLGSPLFANRFQGGFGSAQNSLFGLQNQAGTPNQFGLQNQLNLQNQVGVQGQLGFPSLLGFQNQLGLQSQLDQNQLGLRGPQNQFGLQNFGLQSPLGLQNQFDQSQLGLRSPQNQFGFQNVGLQSQLGLQNPFELQNQLQAQLALRNQLNFQNPFGSSQLNQFSLGQQNQFGLGQQNQFSQIAGQPLLGNSFSLQSLNNNELGSSPFLSSSQLGLSNSLFGLRNLQNSNQLGLSNSFQGLLPSNQLLLQGGQFGDISPSFGASIGNDRFPFTSSSLNNRFAMSSINSPLFRPQPAGLSDAQQFPINSFGDVFNQPSSGNDFNQRFRVAGQTRPFRNEGVTQNERAISFGPNGVQDGSRFQQAFNQFPLSNLNDRPLHSPLSQRNPVATGESATSTNRVNPVSSQVSPFANQIDPFFNPNDRFPNRPPFSITQGNFINNNGPNSSNQNSNGPSAFQVNSESGPTFSCAGRPAGYYADVRSGCRRFHICAEDGNRNTFPCPDGTIFSQINSVCQWGDDVDCQKSHLFFPRAPNPTLINPTSPPFNTQIPRPSNRPSRRQVSATTPPSYRPPSSKQHIKGSQQSNVEPTLETNGPKIQLFTLKGERSGLPPNSDK